MPRPAAFRLVRLSGATALTAGLAAIALTLGGEGDKARQALGLALALGGAGLLLAAFVYFRTRRPRAPQEPS